MSHYAVLVIHDKGQGIEELLAPYDENLKVEPYLKYKHDDAIEMIKKEYIPFNNDIKEYSDNELLNWFVKQYSSYFLKDGDIYTTYNPNSKWDWYQIGGRFGSRLPLTNEALKKEYSEYADYPFTDIAPINYVNWKYKHLTEEEKNKIRRWWEINIYNMPLKEGEEKDKYLFYNPKYYERRYRDAETDIKVQEIINFFAVITPDGKWYAPSNMGWWACTDGEPEDELKFDLEFYDRFIKPNLDSDLMCTVVDCHI